MHTPQDTLPYHPILYFNLLYLYCAILRFLQINTTLYCYIRYYYSINTVSSLIPIPIPIPIIRTITSTMGISTTIIITTTIITIYIYIYIYIYILYYTKQTLVYLNNQCKGSRYKNIIANSSPLSMFWFVIRGRVCALNPRPYALNRNDIVRVAV